MAFVKYTANPKNETNDCIVRSIAKATNKPWQDVMRGLCDIAIDMCLMPNDADVVNEYMYNEGVYVYSAGENTTVEQFARKNPQGSFILCCEDHGVALVDGDWFDLTDSAKSIVVDYYPIKGE